LDIEAVAPELRPALAKLPALDNSKKLVRLVGRLGPQLLRATRIDGLTVSVVKRPGLRARIYRPEHSVTGPGLLWIHGGGLVIGAAKQDDRLCAETAHRLGITVVSIEYRLAPESPQRSGAEIGIDPSRVAVGGESAGAGIAASLVQSLRDTSEVQPVAQWLFAPMLDDRTAARTELDTIDHPVWNNRANRFGWASYLGTEPGSAEVPAYSVPARRTDLSGLPPAWLYAGDIELFRAEIEDYAERLRAAGVPVSFEIVTGAAHGFENWAAATNLARGLVRRAQDWLAATIDVAPAN
jgi:acetyl esterase/lipase